MQNTSHLKQGHTNRATILPGYWYDHLAINATSAIFHQWEQLEASGCIENFRIAAGDVDGLREGWFFADSDAYKWLDAAARAYASHPDPKLASLMDDFIALLARTQDPDGYIYTYNQIHFPDMRWVNLQIEHELYCHGHLIEAGVSHYEATARTDLLDIARRAADRIVEDFSGKGPAYTPGHQEIEIALLRLYRVSQHTPYLDMARQFIEQRGRDPFFALSILKQNFSVGAREKTVQQKKQDYLAAHPDFNPFQLPPGNEAKKPWNATLRWNLSALTGKYFQQHAPVRKQTVPVGHSVRFAYLETAIAMLARESKDQSLVPALAQAWEHMVTRRMYVTGGIGSMPALEGFGNDFELDPEYAYTETCAALGSMFWNWEMTQLTGEPRYSDLFEWQLYNAASVGMGMDGTTYFYNNPLTCHGGVSRQAWYAVPCCPSNLSRTWADLGKYIYLQTEQSIEIHQYISSEFSTELAHLEMHSEMPWQGKVVIHVTPATSSCKFSINLRIPSWSADPHVLCAGESIESPLLTRSMDPVASGYDPRQSRWLSIQREWEAGDQIEIQFDMSAQLRRAHPKVKEHHGKAAVTRGPLVYCLESVDNPHIDIFNTRLNTSTLTETFEPDLFGGTVLLTAMTPDSKPLKFIPYHLWGNRGVSEMTVWVNA
jgi:hypothetical protein